MQLELDAEFKGHRTISPFRELGAYETLWKDSKANFKTIAEKFADKPGAVPSDFVSHEEADTNAEYVFEKLHAGVTKFGVRVHGAAEYPEKLRDARHPIELLYYQGWWDLVNSKSVAVVGTRNPTEEGQARTRKLVKALVADDYTIVSGLAKGVDTITHTTAMEQGGRTIAVIGTPLSHTYPKDNIDLQKEIANNFLLISQVPVIRYESQDYRYNRLFFPERNKTMSALTEATIIVEAGETSGTLIQARAALEQGRKLFILDSCFKNKNLTWPARFAEKGAIRVRDYDDIRNAFS
ncbi:MAG: DNA-processing protein DprA [Gammaproteobacteria bacterium]|jgi:DNA processing protein|nr:DNA-protecting protein DprA [Pseudomonadales bacterium]